ncbi:hypothetical protein PORCRE_825 [Porphyromonas crevioricanis JCM 15906]|uniref:Uncharacterized protein n=1 Tax=Porphyromonas crevioricanis JCM 15906 TaxID=1305617 RepID=T1CMX2_9PORP|nr:hypothetical protein PORCRE_825 [Porphyromonas crevioricanis JCM 15906]
MLKFFDLSLFLAISTAFRKEKRKAVFLSLSLLFLCWERIDYLCASSELPSGYSLLISGL